MSSFSCANPVVIRLFGPARIPYRGRFDSPNSLKNRLNTPKASSREYSGFPLPRLPPTLGGDDVVEGCGDGLFMGLGDGQMDLLNCVIDSMAGSCSGCVDQAS